MRVPWKLTQNVSRCLLADTLVLEHALVSQSHPGSGYGKHTAERPYINGLIYFSLEHFWSAVRFCSSVETDTRHDALVLSFFKAREAGISKFELVAYIDDVFRLDVSVPSIVR